jgi:hypothetical protein
MKKKSIKAEDFDKPFDEGKEDITPYLDLESTFRPGHEAKRVNVDFPQWMVDELDRESSRLGVPRQSLIKVWIAERLQQDAAVRAPSRARPARKAVTAKPKPTPPR